MVLVVVIRPDSSMVNRILSLDVVLCPILKYSVPLLLESIFIKILPKLFIVISSENVLELPSVDVIEWE